MGLSQQFLSLDDIGDSSHVNMDMKKDHQPKVREATLLLFCPSLREGFPR